jgi:hypothetical protein
MSDTERVGEETAWTGLSGVEIQEVARRQLIASVAVAVVIALGVGVAAVMPAHHDYAALAQHRTAFVQQPKFMPPPGGRVASVTRHQLELP